jgi:hypothetical protein
MVKSSGPNLCLLISMSKCILVNIAESGSMHGSQGKSAHKGVEALVLGTLGMPVRVRQPCF